MSKNKKYGSLSDGKSAHPLNKIPGRAHMDHNLPTLRPWEAFDPCFGSWTGGLDVPALHVFLFGLWVQGCLEGLDVGANFVLGREVQMLAVGTLHKFLVQGHG